MLRSLAVKLIINNIFLGAVYKLRLKEEGVGGQKNRLFVIFHTVENVNEGG